MLCEDSESGSPALVKDAPVVGPQGLAASPYFADGDTEAQRQRTPNRIRTYNLCVSYH
jgi:hypothetical protein